MAKKKAHIINRELSWLQFNARVLQESIDPDTPLLEKIKFLGIYSNNLDEFFRIRVATLNRMTGVNKKLYGDVSINPRKTLKEINLVDKQKQVEFQGIFRSIVHDLAKNNVFIVNEKELTKEQGEFVSAYFQENVRSKLFPIMLGNLRKATLDDRSLYLAVVLQVRNNADRERYALIEVPVGPLPRFLRLPDQEDKKYIILLDDIIRYCLDDIFSVFGFNVFRAYAIKFTRDAELDIDSDISKSFLEIMSESLKQRDVGSPVRFTYDRHMPEKLLSMVLALLQITKRDTVLPSGRYHNFRDFMHFPHLEIPGATFEKWPPLPHPALSGKESIFARIRKTDIMVQYPYQSFHHIIDLLREASIDPQVRAIKMTLYRVASSSNVVNALINAARNGKEVTVFLEVQARFDEEANIFWAEKMQEEGVRVIQSIPGFKVHAKLLLIRRHEIDEKNVYYAGISTGNFNETTAKIYADSTLFTANKEIASEVNSVFHLFDSKYSIPRFKHLVVAPFAMRNFFIRLINNEIRIAKKGREAWIILKLNSLADEKIVRKLYEASQSGVKIKLIIRGICVLIPGVPGLSDNIEAISIVDRYLEHSRVFVFCDGGDNKYFISSADWMVRNFDNRIETACPVYDKTLQQELMKMLQIQWSDNSKARYLGEKNTNEYRERETGELKIQSQLETYNYFLNNSLKK
ncbi:MAG TPA: polyphosphate kinase 1 [Bacteroidales bacterium]|jgi:polyphosphate kinase|nr:polyphosphate kinase 1 [Bacteroidales bacterium]